MYLQGGGGYGSGGGGGGPMGGGGGAPMFDRRGDPAGYPAPVQGGRGDMGGLGPMRGPDPYAS